MEGELIIVTIISSLFGLLGLQLLNHNWFKKQRFKTDSELLRAENKIRLKKLEKDLLGQTAPAAAQPPLQSSSAANQNILMQLAPLLKNLDSDQIAGLIDRFTGGGEEGEPIEDNSLGGIITRFAAENPEIVQGFLNGLKNRADGAGGSTTY
jgi:hypothetical protein